MSRWKILLPLCAVGCLLGCSSEDGDQLSLATPPRAASSMAPTPTEAPLPPDHFAQRPPSAAFVDPAKTDDLPLWPPNAAPSAPLVPGSAPPPIGVPSVPANPAPTLEPAAENPQPSFTPPQFAQPQFAPALPAFDPPADPAIPLDDANPLRGSAPSSAPPQVAAVPAFPSLPSLPKPVAPSPGPDYNPLRSGSSVPLLPHAPPETPVESAPLESAPAPAAPAVADTPPAEVTPPSFPKFTTNAAPSRLPRVPVLPPKAGTSQARSFAPLNLNPSGGSAPPALSRTVDVEAYGPPPTKSDPPGTAIPSFPAAAPAPPPALPGPTDSPAPPADPPSFAPPTFAPAVPQSTEEAPPVPADPPSFAPPMFEPSAAADPSDAPAAPESQPAAVEPTAVEPAAGEPAASIAAPAPKATTAIVPPVVGNEPYDVVRVFYGTDRLPILVNQDTFLWRVVRFLPAVVLIALTAFGVGVVWVSRKFKWLIGTSALIFCSALAVWHGVSETLAIAEMAANEEPRYSAERSDRGRIDRGICEVAIPKTHRPGELEAPSVWRFEREFDPSKHVTLRKTVRLHNDAFYEQLRAQVASSPDREILVFVHGFNVSFEDAARRTAQMANDLKLQGAPVFYSWPADKYFLLTYGKDEASVGWAAPHLKEFLIDLVHNTDARAINLVAHSMGNRALTTALREIDLQLRDEARMFNQVVLAAPDIDADDFRDNIAPAIQRTAKQVTLYASSRDIALGASRIFHRNARAGDTSRGLVLVAGMHTIDVSNIDGGPWGHSYYGASDPVLRDLHLLLTSLPPERRTWLKMDELNGQTYWAFKPLGMASGPGPEPR